MGIMAASGPAAQVGEMGPRDVAVIPIESLPASAFEGAARSEVAEGESGLEVLAVLRDPRNVPLDRFLYALTEDGQVLVHPSADAIRMSFEGRGHSAAAVYVRVTAPAVIAADGVELDPFYVGALDPSASEEWFPAPWDMMGIVDTDPDASVLPCLEPMTIEDGAREFDAPDTGKRIRRDEYLPPTPRYQVVDQTGVPGMVMGAMAPGEVREGWLLCLAPDVPVEDVKVVEAWGGLPDDVTHGGGGPWWVGIDEMPAGAWYRLEDRQVVAWNKESAEAGGEPRRVDEQVVYTGEVWVSVGEALRYVYPGSEGAQDRFSEVYALQMTFEGMDDLLGTWDQLALKDRVELTFCGDVWSLDCGSAVPVEVRAQGTWINGSNVDYGEYDDAAKHEVVWVHPDSLGEPGEAGKLPVWRVEFEELRVEDLGVDAPCAATEYVTGVVEGGTERAFPLIAPGVGAFGLTVKSARFVEGEILHAVGMDVYLDTPSSSASGGQYKWLVVEVEGEGIEYRVTPWNVAEAEGVDAAWRGVDYGIASGYETLGGARSSQAWSGYTRAGRNGTVIVAEVPADWEMEDIVLIAGYTGPAWELPR
jgi:hypothetical protein